MLTGDQSKLDALINLPEDYEILELVRTGLTGLSHGSDDVRYLPCKQMNLKILKEEKEDGKDLLSGRL